MPVTVGDIQQARTRIQDGIYDSPCPESIPLSELCGAEIYCKLEYLQRTGSFKERGARNALLCLSKEAASRGVIAASAGNHALGLSYHGSLLGINVTVVMPTFAPLIKRVTCKRLGATVILHGNTFDEAQAEAMRLSEEKQLTYVHGFNDPEIIAGQGTISLELLEQVSGIDAVVVPVGGGGLIAGMAVALKAARPDIKVYGVEPENAAGFSAAQQAGEPVKLDLKPTLADGLAVAQVGQNAFSLAEGLVDEVVTVSEDELSLAVLRLMEYEKGVVEGGGAAPLAAMLSGRLGQLKAKKVVLILSGGNIEPMVLSRVIERGMVNDGRLTRFSAVIGDYPGQLALVTRIIAEAGASVKSVTHDRAFTGPNLFAVSIVCDVETRDHQHIRKLWSSLEEAGIEFYKR